MCSRTTGLCSQLRVTTGKADGARQLLPNERGQPASSIEHLNHGNSPSLPSPLPLFNSFFRAFTKRTTHLL